MNKDKLRYLAGKLLFDMKDSEYETLEKEFSIILKQMDLIGKIDNIKSVEPMTFPFELDNVVLREDIIEDRLKSEEIILNASNVECDMIKLPKVVE